MVTRVYGKANGAEVIFSYVAGDVWETDVPWTEDGQYMLDLYGENDAGNVAYLCRTLFVISGHEIHGYIVPDGYSGEVSANIYGALPEIGTLFRALAWERGFSADVLRDTGYYVQVKERGYGLERIVCRRAAG